jgi:polyhydroxyalkanoate synthesis regulator phasin
VGRNGHGLLFQQADVRKRGADYQKMSLGEMSDEHIRAVVAETLAEQQRLHHGDIDAVVLRTIATILVSFGIEEEDRQELRADFQHLRRWRKSVEQAQSYTFKAVITIIVSGFVGAVWLGVKAMLGK